MEVKQKPCKGTGKAKTFQGCQESVFKRTYGLCPSCYAKWLLNTPEGREKVQKMTLKATKPRRELEKATKERKQGSKLANLKIAVRKVCHDYIKLRDKGKPCVSCQAPWKPDFQAGHWKKAELYSLLKYDERNIHGQCPRCNLFLDGNTQKYADNIANRIGDKGKEEVNQLAQKEKQTNFKWDMLELNKIRDYYKEKIKNFK